LGEQLDQGSFIVGNQRKFLCKKHLPKTTVPVIIFCSPSEWAEREFGFYRDADLG